MVVRKLAALAGAMVVMAAAVPASAQFFFQPPVLRGATVNGSEPGMVGPPLPGATPAEYRAALVWNMRAALNVAALQCQFAPYLLTLPNYNKLLKDHEKELDVSYDTLAAYFNRVSPSKKAGQTALDQYGTKVYSGFSTVNAQLTFCQTAGDISNAAIFAPRGSLGTVAEERMREMRNSLVLAGEQKFPWGINPRPITLPSLEDRCWRKGEWQARKCGAMPSYGGV